MVKVYENRYSYDYPFPAVTLAYFLRYPNPYSKHVLSTDVIDSYVDPFTSRLHTVRLHLKRSRIPPAVLKLLPRSILGSMGTHGGQSYILESSIVDVKEGWMQTESKNMEWTGVLSVVENQVYSRSSLERATDDGRLDPSFTSALPDGPARTDVQTTITFRSRLGEGRLARQMKPPSGASPSMSSDGDEEEATARKGLFSSWSRSSMQRSIELISLRRTRDHLSKSTDGMKIVLERLRKGGVVGVLEGMKRDREAAFGQEGRWRRTWRKGIQDDQEEALSVDGHEDD
ncbi:MAG: hypothetical protein M1826_006429 [Phylliscum demangeonii]|nr:MAG: hypothetical protein M1826_006429 [Phylliscum demangeonii]